MPTRATILLLPVVSLAACDPTPGPFADDLPEGAYLIPASDEVYFALTVEGKSSVQDVALVNGGSKKATLRAVRIEGRDASVFVIESMVPDFPNEKTVEPRAAAGIRIRFTPTRRHVALATLVIESNSSGGDPLEIELIGPGQVDPIPLEPDIAVLEGTVEIAERAGFSQPVALARYFNLGGHALEASRYNLSDDTHFRLVPGTPVPGVPCDPLGLCQPAAGQAQGCCELNCRGECDGGAWAGDACACSLAMVDAGTCRLPAQACPGEETGDPNVECLNISCEPVRVPSGGHAVVPLGFVDPTANGSYDFTIAIGSNDPDHGTQTVAVRGSL